MHRINALKELIVAVKNGQEELDVIVAVVKRGNLGLELNDVVSQARWLKAQNISFVGSLVSSKQTIPR